jgi:hypothetical protein
MKKKRNSTRRERARSIKISRSRQKKSVWSLVEELAAEAAALAGVEAPAAAAVEAAAEAAGAEAPAAEAAAEAAAVLDPVDLEEMEG